MSSFLRASTRLRLRELCLIAALTLTSSACGGAHALAPLPLPSPGALPIAWLSPTESRDASTISRWRTAVGSPLVTPATSGAVSSDAITIVSWNVALDDGDVVGLVREIQSRTSDRPIVLLLQEVFRSGDDVPAGPLKAGFATHLGRSDKRREVDDLAQQLGLALYYVPSMRNGMPGQHAEDRGNAVLSSLPLSDLSAIELPFERQRRVAVGARVAGLTSNGEPWSLRVVSVHLDNLVSARNGWIGTEFGRTRQARGLRDALGGDEPTVLAGDFNTWFGFADKVYVETARAFPQTRVTDTRRTFRGLLRLDHVFYRVHPEWKVEVRRGESSFGSDHYPLVTTITFGGVDSGVRAGS